MKNDIHFVQTAVILYIVTMSLGCKSEPVVYPERKDIVEAVYASGKIIPENEYKLATLINGTIINKLVKDGDTVVKGQLLYIVRNDAVQQKVDAALKNYDIAAINSSSRSPLLNELKLALQNAEIKVKNDSVTYYRWKNLWAQNIGTQNNLDNIYANYQISLNLKKTAEQQYHASLNDMQVLHSNARSQLSSARNDLNEYYIRSDRDGLVYQTFKETGETVHGNDVLALLGDRCQRIIRLAVDQQDIEKIKIGQQVILQADITGAIIYEATVANIYRVMNETDQTFRVDARFNKLPEQSFVHSSVEANIIVQKKNNALVLRRNALTGKDSVWIQENGKPRKILLNTGIATLDYVEVVSGLNEATAVILKDNK